MLKTQSILAGVGLFTLVFFPGPGPSAQAQTPGTSP